MSNIESLEAMGYSPKNSLYYSLVLGDNSITLRIFDNIESLINYVKETYFGNLGYENEHLDRLGEGFSKGLNDIGFTIGDIVLFAGYQDKRKSSSYSVYNLQVGIKCLTTLL